MELVTSKVFQRVVASVQLPIQHFIDTGFWDPHALPGYEAGDLSDQMVRGSCRYVAKELKRPFIHCYAAVNEFMKDPTTQTWVRREPPIWSHGYVSVPKRKYLMPIVSPLLLASGSTIIRDCSGATLWEFRVSDHRFWTEYYQHVLTDPDCRKARKLAPL